VTRLVPLLLLPIRSTTASIWAGGEKPDGVEHPEAVAGSVSTYPVTLGYEMVSEVVEGRAGRHCGEGG